MTYALPTREQITQRIIALTEAIAASTDPELIEFMRLEQFELLNRLIPEQRLGTATG